MRTTIRLTVRQHRTGFALMGGSTLVLLILGLLAHAWLSLPDVQRCVLPPVDEAASWTEAQGAAYQAMCEPVLAIAGALAFILAGGASVLPLAGAVLVGAPLVAAEIEATTATLAWTLARSRMAWYLPRVVLLAGVAVASSLVLGLLIDTLLVRAMPGVDPWRTMTYVHLRGPMLPARAIVATGAALLASALVPRQVPALVLGVTLAAGSMMGLIALDQTINRANAVMYEGGGEFLDSVLLDASGRVISWEDAEALIPFDDPRFMETFTFRSIGIPDGDAPLVTARNVVLHGALGLVLFLASVPLVERRRPY